MKLDIFTKKTDNNPMDKCAKLAATSSQITTLYHSATGDHAMTDKSPLVVKDRAIILMRAPVKPLPDTNLFDGYQHLEMQVEVSHNSTSKAVNVSAVVVGRQDENSKHATLFYCAGLKKLKLVDMPRYNEKKLIEAAQAAKEDPMIQGVMQHNAGVAKVSFVTL